MIDLDSERCYAAVKSRDVRFDGWFVTAVRTTGIYCRPSCPAITPRRDNVEFFPGAATAQLRGFRACKRCRPDAAPGSPEWNVRQDVVARAMRLVADGVVERDGVAGLAGRLGYSERHLNRLMTDELGAGPLAVARAQRAHTARTLIETTAMPLTEIAFAAGFGSVRQFNDTVREVFASSPTELRQRRGRNPDIASSGAVTVRLPARIPFAGSELLAFLGMRAIPGLESWDGEVYRRTLSLPGGHGTATLRAADDHVAATLALEEWSDLGAAVHRLRRLLDLDADPRAVDAALGADDALADLVAATAGRRAPATLDGFETAMRAVIGQQVSVAGAATVAGRIVQAHGVPLRIADDDLGFVFPTSARLADADDGGFSMPRRRAATMRSLATTIADGELVLDEAADPADARIALLAVKGVGPWTADYIVMRGLAHPDVMLATDLGVVRSAERRGVDLGDGTRWSPWSSYAVHHLWAAESLSTPQEESA